MITFAQSGTIISGASSKTLTESSKSMMTLVEKYYILTEVVIVSEESVAASAALMSWVHNVDISDLTIRKIRDSRKGSRLQVLTSTSS
jgi:hypothetical protein